MSEKATLKAAVSALSELIEEMGQKAAERSVRFSLAAPSPVLDSSAGWWIYVEVSDALDAYGVIRLMEEIVVGESCGEDGNRWFSEGIYRGVPVRVERDRHVGAGNEPEARREVSRARIALEEIQRDLMAASTSIGHGLGACSLALQEVER